MGNSKLHQKKKSGNAIAHIWATSESKGKLKKKLDNTLGQMKMKCQHIKIYILWNS